MKNRSFRSSRSGQVIVITALMVALVLLSTAIFVIETEKDVPAATADTDSFFLYQQAARNTLISALADLTNGGNPSVLTSDLGKLESAIVSSSYQSILQLEFTASNDAPYQNGFNISPPSTNGQGVSSACITMEINSTAADSTSHLECTITVASEVYLCGTYLQLGDNSTHVNLTVTLYNEGSPALARNLFFCFENAAGAWTNADAPTINDFGNGTYAASFTTEPGQASFPLHASALVLDQRGIATMANATCTNTG